MDRLYSSNFYGVPAAGAAPSGYGGYGVLGQGVVPQSLQQSPAYKQTDWRGRQRMEQMVAMGLPFNTDPSRVRAESALSLAMGRPIASTTMPQPWGTWGPLSAGNVSSTGKIKYSDQREREEEIKRTINTPPEKPDAAPEGYVRNSYGYLEPSSWYNKDGTKKTAQEYKEKTKQTPTAPPMPQQQPFNLFSQLPTLPFPQQFSVY